jgi:hypothetical protein
MITNALKTSLEQVSHLRSTIQETPPKEILKISTVSGLTFVALAFINKAPMTFIFTTMTWTVISAYTLGYQLSHSVSPETTQKTLMVSLTVFGSLILGGSISTLFHSCVWLAKTAFSMDVGLSLLLSLWVTGVGGYLAPAAQETLKSAYQLVEKKEFLAFKRLINEKTKLRKGYDQLNLYQKVLLFLSFALSQPLKYLPFQNTFIPKEVAYAISQMIPEQDAQSHLDSLKFIHKYAGRHSLPYEGSQHLAKLLLLLKRENTPIPSSMIDRLLAQLPEMVPNSVSINSVQNFFQDKLIAKLVDQRCQQFVEEFNLSIKKYSRISRTSLHELRTIRHQIFSLDHQCKIWDRWLTQNELKECLSSTIQTKLRSLSLTSLQDLKDQVMRFPNLSNQSSSLQNDDIQAFEYLGDVKCGFKLPDYDDLVKWLNIQEYSQIEEAMRSIGLKTAQDLYDHQIVTPEVLAKEQIKTHLQRYIQTKLPLNLRSFLYRRLSEITQDLTLFKIHRTVSKLFYRIAIGAMVLTPVVTQPKFAIVGLGAGLTYYTAIKIIPSLEDVEFIPNLRVITIIRSLVTERNLFSLTESSKKEMDKFMDASISGQMRILNYELLVTALISSISITTGDTVEVGAGALFQSFFLGREVVEGATQRLKHLKSLAAH